MIASVVSVLVRNMAVALMLAVGLTTTPAALRAAWSERGLVVAALIVLEIIVPLVALATVEVVPLGMFATAIIAVMAVCPGAPMIVRATHDRALGMVIVGLVSLLAPVTVAVWLTVLARVLPFRVSIRPAVVAELTLLKIVVPLAIGVVVVTAWPRVARVLARVALGVFIVGFGIALVLALIKGLPVLARTGPWAFVALFIVVAASIALGHWAGGPRLEDRSALATIAVLGNPALGAAVIAASFGSQDVLALVAAYVIGRTLMLVPYTATVWWVARRRARRMRCAT